MRKLTRTNVTRVEVIDWTTTSARMGEGGRKYTEFFSEVVDVWLSLQDDGRTVKLFIRDKGVKDHGRKVT